ncbi:hypothetical protein pdam_00024309, partial [Pocillopora damicornis]
IICFFVLLPTGATACVKLKRFKEAITWCDKGLAVSFQSLREVGDKSVEEKDHISYDYGGPSSDLKIAKEGGDKHGEGKAYGNLGNAYYGLEYHNLHLKMAKEEGDKHREGYVYCNLGNAYNKLGDKHREGNIYCNLGNAYYKLEAVERVEIRHNS